MFRCTVRKNFFNVLCIVFSGDAFLVSNMFTNFESKSLKFNFNDLTSKNDLESYE